VREQPVADIPVDAIVLVRPGERIPLDGTVTEGATTVNEAPLTGESRPVPKAPGAEVFAGTINHDGALAFRVTRPAGDTTLARIIRMVEEAEDRRAPVEQWVDRFARVYTPLMLALAVLVAIAPPLLAGADWSRWFYNALVMLVIACPCALVIATPVGIVAGLTAAARQGVLIKGGIYLEIAARLRAVALDKTGTLTHGRPEVQTVVPLNGHTEAELLARAAALEAHSEHPLAHAIRTRAAALGLPPIAVTDFQSIPGKGAEGRLDGRPFWIGSHRLLEERAPETPELHARVTALEDVGHSVVIVGNDQHVCGLIGVADRLRESAPQVVRDLKRLGIRTVVMLTGDNPGTAAAIAQAAGLDDYRAELLPADKREAIAELTRLHTAVAMVGDGVNDAPAMAAATLGMAMGSAGTDAAIETADIALMADDLTRLPWLVRHARRVMLTVKANIGFALGLKAAVMLLALGGLATLWLAILADMGASLIVIAYSLRLLKHQP
jgi:Cd2+/Zn2+-exporting ATPase